MHGENEPILVSTSKSSSSSGSFRNTIQECSFIQTVMNTTSFMVGVGLLNLPIALVESRWYGALIVIFVAMLCTYTSKILLKCLDAVRWSNGSPVSYGEIAQEAFGPFAKSMVEIQVYLSLFSSACGYLMITSNYISILFDLSYTAVVLAVGFVIWTHIFLSSLKEISIFSALNIGLAFWVEAVIIADALLPATQEAYATKSASYFSISYPNSVASENLRLAYSFSLVLSAFSIHPALPTIYHSMSTPRDCSKAITWSIQGSLVFFYLPICLITYAVYGIALKIPVFMNLHNTTVRDVAILLFSIHILLSYIVTLHPVEKAVEQHATSTFMNRWKGRTLTVISTVIVVVSLQPASHLYFLIITITIPCLALIFPPLFYMRLFWMEISKCTIITNVWILLIGVWCVSFGFYSTWTCTMKGSPPA